MVEHQPSSWIRGFDSHHLLENRISVLCASGSVVEHHLAKVGAAGSNPVSRFFLFSAEAFIFKGFRCFYLLPCAAVKSKTAPKIIPNPRKSGITKGVPSQKNEMITADKGSTLARMLPFKGPIMDTP